MKRLFLSTSAALALAGCAVGPTYRSPKPQAPGQTPFVSGASQLKPGKTTRRRWNSRVNYGRAKPKSTRVDN